MDNHSIWAAEKLLFVCLLWHRKPQFVDHYWNWSGLETCSMCWPPAGRGRGACSFLVVRVCAVQGGQCHAVFPSLINMPDQEAPLSVEQHKGGGGWGEGETSSGWGGGALFFFSSGPISIQSFAFKEFLLSKVKTTDCSDKTKEALISLAWCPAALCADWQVYTGGTRETQVKSRRDEKRQHLQVCWNEVNSWKSKQIKNVSVLRCENTPQKCDIIILSKEWRRHTVQNTKIRRKFWEPKVHVWSWSHVFNSRTTSGLSDSEYF